jgi:hypothetical protein
MSRRFVVFAVAALLGCAKADAPVEYRQKLDNGMDLRAFAQIKPNGKVTLLIRLVNGDSLVRSWVMSYDHCDVFSRETWRCSNGDDSWIADDGRLTDRREKLGIFRKVGR